MKALPINRYPTLSAPIAEAQLRAVSFAEAKGRGYDPKAMRQIMAIRRKRKEEYQEEASILETYMQALGML